MTHTNGRPAQLTITLTSAGNPALRPELTDTTAIGLVFEPCRAEGCESIHRYEVDIARSIATLGAQRVFDERRSGGARHEEF